MARSCRIALVDVLKIDPQDQLALRSVLALRMMKTREAALVDYDRAVFDVVPVPMATVACFPISRVIGYWKRCTTRKRTPSIKASVVAHKLTASYFASQSRW